MTGSNTVFSYLKQVDQYGYQSQHFEGSGRCDEISGAVHFTDLEVNNSVIKLLYRSIICSQ